MNYAIRSVLINLHATCIKLTGFDRSGIGITASFAISQTSRLLKVRIEVIVDVAADVLQTVENNGDYREIQTLQERLNSKIKVRMLSSVKDVTSPLINMFTDHIPCN